MMNKIVQGLWAQTELIVWKSNYWMIAFEHALKNDVLQLMANDHDKENYSSLIIDNHEISVLLAENYWFEQREKIAYRDEFGPLCGITLDIPLDIEVSGYLQPAVDKLAKGGISIIPQCALIYDHIFVPLKNLDGAISILRELRDQAQTVTLKD